MAVISITITESPIQKVKGIPASIALTTNTPATIFYTLDGTTPTTSSLVITGPLELPTNQNTLTFKAYATDGVDSSSVVTKRYGPDVSANRNPHATVSGIDDLNTGAHFPFGSRSGSDAIGIFGKAGGVVVDSADVLTVADGYAYDVSGDPAAITDEPLTEYEIRFSETDAIGQRGRGIGTLSSNVTVVIPPARDQERSSNANSPLFNPKALVIFQDSTEEPYDADVPQFSSNLFNLDNAAKLKDPSYYYNTAFEGGGSQISGSMLKPQYNPRDGTMTYYYFDSKNLRWIISKESFTPTDPDIYNYSNIIFSSRQTGVGVVFQWLPFRYRTLI